MDVAFWLVLGLVFVPVGYAAALIGLLRTRPSASLKDAAEALAMVMPATGRSKRHAGRGPKGAGV